MVIKKFTGKTEAEATEAARRELGDGIVIMNVRPSKKSGFFAFLFSPKIEVTVALEDEPDKVMQPVRPQTPYARDTAAPRQQPGRPSGEAEALLKKLDEVKTERAAQTAPVTKTPAQEKPSDEQLREAVSEVSRIIEKGLDDDQPQDVTPVRREKAPVKPAAGRPRPEVSRASDDKPQKAAQPQVKNDPPKTEKKQDLSEDQLSFIKILYNTLLSNEVDEIYANQLTDEVEKYSKPGIPLEHQLANVYQKMVLKFGSTQEIPPAGEGPLALIFIGPTGVGKTTTIAKLASELYVGRKARVALLTVDTYRIAAAEQLRTYASILEIPFRVIYSVDEMKQACNDFRDYDYIMVDTAGHNLHNEEQKSTTISFVRTLEECMKTEKYLVLSATTKYRDLIEIADGYAQFTDYKLIFTKMDETSAAGNLYNLRMHTGAGIAYTTDGQNVPDDIAPFDAQKVVKGLLSEQEQ